MRSVPSLVAVVAVAMLAGCGSEATVVADPRSGSARAAAPCPPPDAEGDAQIDWVPFVKVDGLMYTSLQSATENTVPEAALGDLVAAVTCRISDTVGNPDFRPRDGDASYLPVGTELRAFADADPRMRLAVREDGAWRVYEATDIPDARSGAELLDLAGGVTKVELLDGDTATTVLGAVTEAADVARLVDAVLAAPVSSPDDEEFGNEAPVFVRFTLADGTYVQRPWHRKSGVLASRLVAPEELDLLQH